MDDRALRREVPGARLPAGEEAPCTPAGVGLFPADPRGGRGGSRLRRGLRVFHDYLEYRRIKRRLEAAAEDLECLFGQFLTATVGRRALFFGFDAPRLGRSWEVVELSRLESRGRPIRLDLPDAQVDALFCTGLERVSRPRLLIAELGRVLGEGGQIWIEAPVCGPCRPEAVGEYWRLTPEGLRVLMAEFDEIFCSLYLPGGSPLRARTFFYGLKPSGAPPPRGPPAAGRERRP